MTMTNAESAATKLWNAWQAGETLIALPAELRPADAAALGDPRTSLCWLADELARFDLELRPVDVVTTGTAAPPAPIAPGDTVVAEITGRARLSVDFTA